jgi:hypothetical protein
LPTAGPGGLAARRFPATACPMRSLNTQSCLP